MTIQGGTDGSDALLAHDQKQDATLTSNETVKCNCAMSWYYNMGPCMKTDRWIDNSICLLFVYYFGLNLYSAWVSNAPQHEKSKRKKSSPQKVPEGCEVGYWVAVRVFTLTPQTVYHTVSYRQQEEDLRNRDQRVTIDQASTKVCKEDIMAWLTHLNQGSRQEEHSEEKTRKSVASLHQVSSI